MRQKLSHRQTLTQLALDESQGILAVLASVALVSVGVVAVAAVRIGRIAVRLDLVRRWAGESTWAGVELKISQERLKLVEIETSILPSWKCLLHKQKQNAMEKKNDYTYPTSVAGPDFVRQAGNVERIAHENRRGDHLDSTRRDRHASVRNSLIGDTTATESSVHDFTTLERRSLVPGIHNWSKLLFYCFESVVKLTWEYPTSTI